MIDFEFRAFDKEIKKMFYVGSIIQALKQNNECADDHWLLNTDHDLMLYTGLKDRNVKKIWQGDIVKVFWDNPRIYIVENYQRGKSAFFQWQFSDPNDSSHYSAAGGCDVEVIGNIHENPEIKIGE